MIFAAQTSMAFDARGERDESKDEWKIEDVGHIPEDVLPQFIQSRYQGAFKVLRIPEEKESEYLLSIPEFIKRASQIDS